MDGLKKSDSIDGAAFPPLPLRADGPRECAPDDRFREANHRAA
jgi:hypothetical protein